MHSTIKKCIFLLLLGIPGHPGQPGAKGTATIRSLKDPLLSKLSRALYDQLMHLLNMCLSVLGATGEAGRIINAGNRA